MTDTNDLVKELRTPVGFQDLPFIQEEAADRIEELEELLKAAQDDAKEAEAYAGELEANLSESKALLAKAVEALQDAKRLKDEALKVACQLPRHSIAKHDLQLAADLFELKEEAIQELTGGKDE